jgi:Spy/CpxP family protein refolding chaperone
MPTLVKITAALLTASFLAACAQSVAQPNLDPPQRRQTDAKTQLESGRRF